MAAYGKAISLLGKEVDHHTDSWCAMSDYEVVLAAGEATCESIVDSYHDVAGGSISGVDLAVIVTTYVKGWLSDVPAA